MRHWLICLYIFSSRLQNPATFGDDERARKAIFKIRESSPKFIHRGKLPEKCAGVHVFKCIAGRTPSSARVPLDRCRDGTGENRVEARRTRGDRGVARRPGGLPHFTGSAPLRRLCRREGMFYRLQPQTDFQSQPILPASAEIFFMQCLVQFGVTHGYE